MSLNRKVFISMVFYFVDKDFKVQNLLAGIKRVKGAKTGENIIKTIILIIERIISNK